jgi:DNA (cytosine-5)-methyltransferase 3A
MIQNTINNTYPIEGLNVLSLFDGISCGQIALERIGYKVNKYFASEIKKHAIKCTNNNYPQTIQLGDVRNICYSKNCIEVDDGDSRTKFNIDTIHLFLAGSPCKGISRLNKNQTGLEHVESRLFYEAVKILREVQDDNPNVYFLFENTHGNREAVEIITETLGVNPISINSRLVSAQNRPRYYWTNIPDITQPTDKGITTKDVFDFSGDVVDKHRVKWLESESGRNSIKMGYTKVNPYPKSGCITASGHKKWNENYLFKDGTYYYLSQTELEKLQTLPIGYTSVLNYDEAYDCIGDGWTVDVIAHILKNIVIPKTIIR